MQPRNNTGTLRRALSTRDLVLTGVGMVLLAAAVFLFWRGGGDGGIPSDPSSYVYFKCPACGARFHLNGQEIDQALRASSGPKSMKPTLFPCKKCGKREAVRDTNQSP